MDTEGNNEEMTGLASCGMDGAPNYASNSQGNSALAHQQQFYPDTTRIKVEPLDDFYHFGDGTPASATYVGTGMFDLAPGSETQLHKDSSFAPQLKGPVAASNNSARNKLRNKCGVCGRHFGLKVLLKRHLKSHSRNTEHRRSESIGRLKSFKGVRLKKCAATRSRSKITKHSFALRKLFRCGHVRIRSKTKQVGAMASHSLCFVCQKWFSYRAVFKLHMTKIHNSLSAPMFSRNFQTNAFNNIGSFGNSTFATPTMAIAGGTDKINVTATSINIPGGKQQTTKEKKYKCPLCEKSFTQSGKLSSHKKKHSGEKPFHCSVCGKDFALKDHLNIHIKIHTGERPYPCTLCDKSFRQGGHLRVHMQTHTGVKPFKCEFCDKAFSQKGSLMSHMRTHTGGKLQYQCPMCDKSFRDSTKLNNHVRTHTGEKPFQCSLCDKAFSQSGDLVRHMRIHTGERPYACTVCNRTFSEGSNLNKHMRTHTGYRPHQCTICDKAFSEGSTLKNHMRIHSGEKPYQCSVCQKEFIQSGDLYKHMRTHTGEKPHSCPICGRAFTESSTLKKHMRTHQKEGLSVGSADVVGKSKSKTSSFGQKNIQFDDDPDWESKHFASRTGSIAGAHNQNVNFDNSVLEASAFLSTVNQNGNATFNNAAFQSEGGAVGEQWSQSQDFDVGSPGAGGGDVNVNTVGSQQSRSVDFSETDHHNDDNVVRSSSCSNPDLNVAFDTFKFKPLNAD